MKPICQSEIVLETTGNHSDADEDLESVSVSKMVSPISDSDTMDDPEPDVLDREQLELRQFLCDILGGIKGLVEWEEFYVQCRVSILNLFLFIHHHLITHSGWLRVCDHSTYSEGFSQRYHSFWYSRCFSFNAPQWSLHSFSFNAAAILSCCFVFSHY